jgi:HSP20 family protein
MVLSPTGRLGWDPFAEMRRMQMEMNRLFSDLEGRVGEVAFPAVNVWAGENDLVLTAEIAGVKPDDLELTVREDTLVISGKREPQIDGDDVTWHRRERAYGQFARTIDLPFRVDPDRVEARFVNGLLELRLQRPEVERPKKIEIKAS